MNIKEQLKQFILEKVKENVSADKPYFFVKWSGLYELCRLYQVDLVKIIDELCKEGRLKKALIKGKLAITLPSMVINKKTSKLLKDFQKFISK